MRHRRIIQLALPLLLLRSPSGAVAQAANPIQTSAQSQTSDRLNLLSDQLLSAQRQLAQTQQQIVDMQRELDALRAATHLANPTPVGQQAPSTPESSSSSLAETVQRQAEQSELQQAEIKQHEQTKLESVSKYPVRVYGLLLFNTYSNAGVVDNQDLPTSALDPARGSSHGSVGASFRQTVLGLRATGPHLLSAESAAEISTDFFGGLGYSSYGNSAGTLRLRRADISLRWKRNHSADEVHVGVDAPLISPLSPTSFATVGQPALAWSGNLWTWSPQLRYKHTTDLWAGTALELEGGLWDPPVLGYDYASSRRYPSPGELARQPGYLGRASFHAGPELHPFTLGVGGYSDQQVFAGTGKIRMWAISADWQIPLARRLGLQGEFYRGRGLGGLGGGAYKDVLTGTDPVTGATRTLGLNAIGGWTELKATLTRSLAFNLSYGQDTAFAGDFHRLTFPSTRGYLDGVARSSTVAANLILRPRTYLILSPEYRRISTWQITGYGNTANIYTLSMGYEF